MGAVPASGDLITCRIVASIAGSPVINDLSFSIINPAATWADQVSQVGVDLASALGLGGTGVWGAALSSNYQTSELQVVDVVPGTSALGSVGIGAAGEGGADSLPPNDCLCITLRSDFKGQGSRGRLYLSGFTEGDQTNGYWEATAQDAATDIGNALISGFGEFASGANMRWVIIHKTSNHGVKGGPVTKLEPPEVKPVMSFTVHNEVRSLGRRATGRRVPRHRAA